MILDNWDHAQERIISVNAWKQVAFEVCGLKLSISLCNMDNVEIPEVIQILEFFLDTELPVSIKALGLYNTASTFRFRDAGLCYELQSKCFEIYLEIWEKCEGCGNLYAYNFPVSEMGKMNGHYTKNFTYSVIQPRYGLSIYSDIFNKAKKYTNSNQYLEIGIGRGEMLAVAMEMGYEVDAVEICKEDCEKVSSVLGIGVHWCDFIQFETEKRYDLIIMGDVLEHTAEPFYALEKAQSLLNSNGVLWLSTPNYNSGFARLRKFTDPMWNQKNHFTYFSYETLLPILDQLDLEVKRYDISNRYNGSMELYCIKKDIKIF